MLNVDCMDYMASLPDLAFDLAIVDPPYSWNSGNSFTSRLKKYGDIAFNDLRPSPAYFEQLMRVSKHQIVWGGNYFLDDLRDTKCMLVWDKHQPVKTYARIELAWTSFRDRHSDLIDLPYFGATGRDIERCHPNQKPVKLYEELLSRYATAGQKILDTHLGSGSHAIACNNLGFEFAGCEIDPVYFLSACARIKASHAQDRMFA
ncbi:MAG TPA: DNA methyltransferase [Methylophilaceae bacterium]|nr:DNA methyltransferase [Methylophilaceae bacterium]